MEKTENNKVNDAYGITSVCENGKHIYMGDIDKFLEASQIRRIVNKLFDYWLLSDCLVIETTNGFNFVSFDKMNLAEIHQINQNIKDMDQAFNEYNYKRKYYTLRIASDKCVYGYYTNVAKNYKIHSLSIEKSNGHREFFNNLFRIQIPKDPLYDDSQYFQMVKYEETKER